MAKSYRVYVRGRGPNHKADPPLDIIMADPENEDGAAILVPVKTEIKESPDGREREQRFV